MARLTEHEKDKIRALDNEGYSSRAIAMRLWRQPSRKSTVGDYLRSLNSAAVQVPDSYGPNVLVLDIETAPILANVWRLFKENVGLNQIREDWYIMSWAAKWLGSDEVYYQDVRDCGLDDKGILQQLWVLLDKADWVITHNGDRFDLPKIRARMLIQGLTPFSPVKSIDTCKAAKKAFGFTSNKLEYLSNKLCPEHQKSSHSKFPGFNLWKECIKGNTEAWDEMRDYNIDDVYALESLYFKLRPWIPSHPNFSLYTKDVETHCNCCGSEDMEEWHTKAYTNLSEFTLYRCNDCGTFKRGRTNNLTKDKRQGILMNID